MRPSRALIAAVLAVGALAVAGCGGDDETTSANTTTTDTETTAAGGGGDSGGGAGETLQVSLVDYKLDPPNPTVSAGPLTIEASNDGQVVHNIEVEGPEDEVELPNDLAPGESGTLDVDMSKPGSYEWYCPVGNHRDLGMEGEITVK